MSRAVLLEDEICRAGELSRGEIHGGKPPKKVIVAQRKLVNIVV
jgi:hypothetical protein